MIEISSLHEKALKRLSPSIQYKNDKNKYKDIILKSRGIFFKRYLYIFIFGSGDGLGDLIHTC